MAKSRRWKITQIPLFHNDVAAALEFYLQIMRFCKSAPPPKEFVEDYLANKYFVREYLDDIPFGRNPCPEWVDGVVSYFLHRHM